MKYLHSLPYVKDGSQYFQSIAQQPWAIFLDSGKLENRPGYDILVADPVIKLVTEGENTSITDQSGTMVSDRDPFELVRNALEPFPDENPGLPFAGGAIGYFAYDLGRRIEKLPQLAENDEALPEMMVGIYDWALVIDHIKASCTLVGQDAGRMTSGRWAEIVTRFEQSLRPLQTSGFMVTDSIEPALCPKTYASAYHRIKDYIYEGDCYQVNLAQRFTVESVGDPWVAYQSLRQVNSAPFSAYLNFPQLQILSCSPERFITLQDGMAMTSPIKGTRPRSNNKVEDQALKQSLSSSAKDRAENVMIVDLLRNDFGKVCVPGSIDASCLFEVESFATVHHLVSTITGKLREKEDALSLLRYCFPGGSITGAPKLRSMEIIEELEPFRRGVYCGSIGYIGFDGNMDTNIAIRTLTHRQGYLRFWAGGGIVHDSTLEGEYQESFDKAAAMLNLFGNSESWKAGLFVEPEI